MSIRLAVFELVGLHYLVIAISILSGVVNFLCQIFVHIQDELTQCFRRFAQGAHVNQVGVVMDVNKLLLSYLKLWHKVYNRNN